MEARKRSFSVLDEIYQNFEAARQRRCPSDEAIKKAVWSFFKRELVIDEIERQQNRGSESLLERNKLFRDPEMAALRKHLAEGETALVEWAADEIIKRNKFLISKESRGYEQLCHLIAKAKIEALRLAKERDQGIFEGSPNPEMVAQPSKEETGQSAPPGRSLANLFELYAREKAETIKADTLDQNRKAVALFFEFVGRSSGADTLTRKNVAAWKDALNAWPRKAAEITELKGLDFRATIEVNRALGRPTISQRTINKYLTALSGFCRWLRYRGDINDNPVEGNLTSLRRDRQEIAPYSSEQLKTIFNSPLFTGCLSDAKEHESGNHLVLDHRFWLPLLSLFSGARLGELCQLLVEDVREESGTWIIHITTDGDEAKRLKTKNAYRVVPLHSELIRLGFLRHVSTQNKRSARRLFPEIKPDARGFLSGFPSRWYGRYTKRIGVKEDKSLNFHSYRHSFIDALRRAGYFKEAYQPLIGHAGATVTDRYGRLPDGTLAKRLEMVEAVSYPDLDLSHLYDSENV
ncbi:integrase [Limibacillus halophilus]|uniref:Integrase n=2 Tax=Limibacillus halophilus TaxID=1579333 RepID=A0A839SUI0_9PROT|nr:integrase [Limibacillus halophilus]